MSCSVFQMKTNDSAGGCSSAADSVNPLKQVAFDGGLNCGKCQGTIDGKTVTCAELETWEIEHETIRVHQPRGLWDRRSIQNDLNGKERAARD
jgi:hypothetical protein